MQEIIQTYPSISLSKVIFQKNIDFRVATLKFRVKLLGEEPDKHSCFVLILLSISCLLHVPVVIMHSLCDNKICLTLKAPITTVADDIHKYFSLLS